MTTEKFSEKLNHLDPNGRLSVNFFGHVMRSPLILGSGTLVERKEQIPPYLIEGAGAIIPRTTRKIMERKRHPSPHLFQTGKFGRESMINSEWTGADIEYWRPFLEEMSNWGQVLMSVSGRDIKGCADVCKELDRHKFPLIEVNVSCAHSNNVHGFITRNGNHIRKLVSEIKDNTPNNTPVSIKLGYSDQIVELASIAKDSGADSITAINTFGPVFDFNIKRGKPIPVIGIENALGGLSGESIFNIALTAVAQIISAVKIPVIACGGVNNAERVVKMIMAGATGVQIYSAAHVKGINAPNYFSELNKDVLKFLNENEIGKLEDVKGDALNLLNQKTNLEKHVPVIDENNCTGCDKCIQICLPQAFLLKRFNNKAGHIVGINKDACIGCGHCVSICPTSALEINS